MKQFSKTYLPDSIEYNGAVYTVNLSISVAMSLNNTRPSTIADTLKKEGRKAVLVNVLPKTLKGKTDLYGQPYKPTQYIFTTQ